MSSKIIVRKKKRGITRREQFDKNFEQYVGYWRENPHRFCIEYLGLRLYDFQKEMLYCMFKYPNMIYVTSRGLAKSTVALIFAIIYCILYPRTNVIVVTPIKGQSTRFIKKINDFLFDSPNLKKEIAIKSGKLDIAYTINDAHITFNNGSNIFSAPCSENSLGIRANILIVDEFVRTDEDILTRVFNPMLTTERMPFYYDLTKKERENLVVEPNRRLYLSSIRGADEWSFHKFEEYLEYMMKGDLSYFTIALPYNFGVKAGYLSRTTVENSFKENREATEMLIAEYCGIPERSSGNAFYKYNSLYRKREEVRALIAMTTEEYITYKDDKTKYPYYLEKKINEIRILCIDIALVESAKNDNTSIWVIRLLPKDGKYHRICAYSESIHGANSIVQAKRMKQLFYEMDCDYVAMDAMGVGMGIFDICTTETFDDERNLTYPAWTVINADENKMTNRTIDPNAVPIVYTIKTSAKEKSQMLTHCRDIFSTDDISLLVDVQEAIDYLDDNYKYYKMDEGYAKARLLNPYVQTSAFITEATNLEQIVVQGYISAKEKSGRRKDRVMSLVYGLSIALILEEQLQKPQETNILDYIFSI